MSSHCSRYPACGCSPDIGTKCHLPNVGPNEATEELTKEVASQQNPGLKEAYEALNEADKEALKRGHKMWKKTKKGEYILMDNFPWSNKTTKFTPPKKKRKKR